MSEISRQFDATGKLPDRQIPTYTGENESQWVGWISFASTILILLGSFHIIQGLVALFRDEVFVVHKSGLIVNVDYTAWGWFHIVLGAIMIATSIGLFAMKGWARWAGIFFASLSAITQVGVLPAFPIWGLIVIALDVVVIYQLTARWEPVY